MTQTAAAATENKPLEVRQEEIERRPELQIPITPLVKSEREPRQEREREAEPTQGILPTETEFAALMKMAEMLAQSGFLPSKLNTPGKVLAVILTGREMGFAPMLACRAIRIQEKTGYPIMLADALLGNFKSRGGRAKFNELTEQRGVLWLRHPNGDEHTETYTVEMARKAGLFERKGERNEPSNWERNPKPMIRSRCITAGLKSVGWEPASAAYDADEAEEIAAAQGFPSTITATVSESGNVEASDAKTEDDAPRYRLRGMFLDARTADGAYCLSVTSLQRNYDWALDMATKASDEKQKKDVDRFNGLAQAILRELRRRDDEEKAQPFKEGISVGEPFPSSDSGASFEGANEEVDSDGGFPGS